MATAIVEFVTAVLPENSLRMTKPLVGEFERFRSARRGDYRVIVRIDDQAHIVCTGRRTATTHTGRDDRSRR